jgi:thiol-disulfide isomerase/thioredoxin
MKKSLLSWGIRILISALFIISAYAKIYHEPSAYFSITTFEAKQLVPLGFDTYIAAIFSRVLIALELSLGVFILLPFCFKKLVLPGTIALLGIFCIHLGIQIYLTGNSGNCGCFGALLPMTPMEAIIKNILASGLLMALYKLPTNESENKNSFYILLALYFLSIISIFIYLPIKSSSNVVQSSFVIDSNINDVNGPKSVKSEFGEALPFADSGRVLLCFFAPGCDHCRATIRSIDSLSKITSKFPKVEIVFMEEEVEKIPEFFAYAGSKYSYRVLDISSFYNVLTWERDTPAVFYIWNGNVLREFNGINEMSFNAEQLVETISQ